MKKKTLLNALLLAPLLLANGLVSGQETEALPPPDQLVQWLDSADFYQRQSATAGLVTQQSGAVVPVLEQIGRAHV